MKLTQIWDSRVLHQVFTAYHAEYHNIRGGYVNASYVVVNRPPINDAYAVGPQKSGRQDRSSRKTPRVPIHLENIMRAGNILLLILLLLGGIWIAIFAALKEIKQKAESGRNR